jgi:hypothetical protein
VSFDLGVREWLACANDLVTGGGGDLAGRPQQISRKILFGTRHLILVSRLEQAAGRRISGWQFPRATRLVSSNGGRAGMILAAKIPGATGCGEQLGSESCKAAE